MNWYKVSLTLKAPSGTPWQADTIWGHLCWILLHQQGEEVLKKFLEPFLRNEPPFLLSDGFPVDMLPRPPLALPDEQKFLSDSDDFQVDLLPRPLTFNIAYKDDIETFHKRREIRKLSYLSYDDFNRAIHGEQFIPSQTKAETGSRETVTLKNQISRLSGTTGETGQLFGFKEYWTRYVTIYLKIKQGWEKQVEDLFNGLRQAGYGKRKSVGYGSIEKLAFMPFAGFPKSEGVNAFVTLSPFIPSSDDPTEGRWRILVKYGKLGEEYATGANPFKRPLLMLTAGSVFLDDSPREFYGTMVTGVSATYSNVVHYAYALPVPMRIPEPSVSSIKGG